MKLRKWIVGLALFLTLGLTACGKPSADKGNGVMYRASANVKAKKGQKAHEDLVLVLKKDGKAQLGEKVETSVKIKGKKYALKNETLSSGTYVKKNDTISYKSNWLADHIYTMRNGKIVPKYADFGGPSKTKFTAKFKLDQDKLVQVSSNNGKFAVSKADSVQNNSSVDVKQYYRQKLIEHLNGWQFKDIEISDSPGKLYLKNGKFVCAGGEHGKWVVVGRGNYQINFSNGTIKLVFTEQSPGTVNSDSDISFPRSRVLKVNNVLWDEKHNNVQFVREKKFQSNVNSLYAKYKAQIEQQ